MDYVDLVKRVHARIRSLTLVLYSRERACQTFRDEKERVHSSLGAGVIQFGATTAVFGKGVGGTLLS